MRDDLDRYVRACRMAANETVRLYTLGGVSIEKLTDMVRDVGRLEMVVSGLTDAERAELNRQLQGKVALRSIFADLMWLRTRNAELKALLLSFSATASADGQVPAASNCDATTSEPLPLHMPPRDD